jgi:hypothetical protein
MQVALGTMSSAKLNVVAPTGPTTTGLIMWYDGNYAASIEYGVAPKVAAWNDRSASNWRFFNTYTPEQPNLVLGGLKTGLNAVEFPNENYALNGPASSGANQKPLTAFAVVKHTGVARDRAMLGTVYDNGFLWEIRPDNRQLVNQHNVANIGNSTSTVPSNVTVILCVTYSATGVLSFYLNNVADGVTTNDKALTASTPQHRIGTGGGAHQGFVGTIGEILKYNTVLGSTDLTTNYDYLAAKWL